jgi:DNA-binding transcriptional ArsR family regulator
MDDLLQGLRAVAEPTRLRILGLCAHGELTVSDLTHILGQSQPRVSRHLKLMVDAGLLERFQEGQYAFYRIAEKGPAGSLAGTLVDLLPEDDAAHTLDLQRLEQVKQARAKKAEAYFRKNAAQWDEIRKLYVDDAEVEAALRRLIPEGETGDLLDIIEKQQDGGLTGIWHCFNGSVEEGRRALDLGLHLGISGVLTFKNAGVDETVEQLPLEKMMLETDAPYLAPAPNRGKRNEPAFVRLTARRLSEVMELSLEKIEDITSRNALRLFGIDTQ